MNALRWPAIVMAGALFAAMFSACVVPDGGYNYYDGGADIGLDYYEPHGAIYGSWEPGYQVGPFYNGGHRPEPGGGHRPDGDGRGDGHRPDGGGHPQPPAYKPAPESHPTPSIPTRPRSKGARPH